MRKKLFVGYLHDRIFGDHYEIKFPDKMENAEEVSFQHLLHFETMVSIVDKRG